MDFSESFSFNFLFDVSKIPYPSVERYLFTRYFTLFIRFEKETIIIRAQRSPDGAGRLAGQPEPKIR